MQDSIWNQRHHVSPSQFNTKNASHYKTYFDKEFRRVDKPFLLPKRELDPYDVNEIKGTRMPNYTKLDKERDIYGELAWVNNFNVKCSKNNTSVYPTFREFFDGPRNYNKTFTKSEMTNQDFFRKNAPK